jgi:hypothetical protein
MGPPGHFLAGTLLPPDLACCVGLQVLQTKDTHKAIEAIAFGKAAFRFVR